MRGWRTLAALDPTIAAALAKSSTPTPSIVQTIAFPKLVAKQPIALAAETGSGKTLAYLVPCFQEAAQKPKEHKFPTALVLVPSKELVHQVYAMANELNRATGIKVSMLEPNLVSSRYSPGIWVSTPQVVKKNQDWFVEKILPNLSYIVFDEADRILSGSNLPIAKTILLEMKKARKKGNPVIPLFIGATMPKNGKRTSGGIAQYFTPDLEFLQTPDAHTPPQNVEQHFENLKEGENVEKRVLSVMESLNDPQKILLFVNTTDSAANMLEFLSKNSDCELYGMSKDYDFDQRMRNIAKFNSKDSVEKVHKVMVCTDLASRGIDFQNVDIVIQAEFALNVVEYLHRIGRTGRFGKKGKVYNFYTDSQSKLATSIKESLEKGETQALHFSRGRLFSKKLKKLKRKEKDAGESSENSSNTSQ
jgi:superfamily II DNA/RNA helicase